MVGNAILLLNFCVTHSNCVFAIVSSVGLFPSIFDWVVNVANRSPLGNEADGNTNFPGGDGWFGILAWKRGALLVSFVWVAILVRFTFHMRMSSCCVHSSLTRVSSSSMSVYRSM